MKAYNSDQKLKDQLIERAEAHQKADEYITGTYYQAGKGCSVGCSIQDVNEINKVAGDHNDHSFLAEQLDVPDFVIRLQDHFFENISEPKRKTWTSDFFEAIPVGADLTPVLKPFLAYVVADANESAGAARALEEEEAAGEAEWAARAAGAAADAGEAAWAAKATAWAAKATARAAAWAKARAAGAAEEAAADAGEAADAAAWAADAAGEKAADSYADEFLRLINESV